MNKTIIYTGAFRFPNGDAAAPRVLNNAKIFRELGYKVIFVSFGGEPRNEDKNIDGNYYYQGFRYINTDDIDLKQTNPIKRILRFIFSGRNAIKIINSIISDSELVIGYQPSSYFTQKMLNICKKQNTHFISDLTEWYAPNEFPGGKFAPPSWLNEWNMRFTQKRVKNKIVISSFLNNYYCTSNNIILPPLVDNEEEKWNYNKEVLPIFDGIRIIYAGTPAKKDLLETMLNALISCIKEGIKLQFIVVGVSKNDISHFKNINEVISFPENILLCGRVPQTDVPSYYKLSDFSIIIREKNRKSMAGFPTKFAESLMSGCPVITNETSDIGDFIIDESNGILLKDNTLSEITNSLKRISTFSQSKILSMKTNSYNSAITKLDYRVYINSMNDFINDIKL